MDNVSTTPLCGKHKHHIELVRRWQARRDICARNEVVKDYLDFARSEAWKRAARAEPLGLGPDDLTQACIEIIIAAIDTFDPDMGFVFATHARWQIMGGLDVLFRQNESLLCREPYGRWKYGTPNRIDLDAPIISPDDGGEFAAVGDNVSDEAAEEERGRLVLERANAALGLLNDFGRRLLESRYREEEGRQSFADLSPIFGKSDERLRQIDADNLALVRKEFLGRNQLIILAKHDVAARTFSDEYWQYRQRGIGYLRRRHDGHILHGLQPRWRAELIWHSGDCCDLAYSFSKKKDRGACGPEARSIKSWQAANSERLGVVAQACATVCILDHPRQLSWVHFRIRQYRDDGVACGPPEGPLDPQVLYVRWRTIEEERLANPDELQ